MDPDVQRQHVSEYYGVTLQTSSDLRTSACCPTDAVPSLHRRILSQLHPDVTSRFYGCGSPIPSHLRGAHVLDLGCGTGRDVYLASALVGPSGSVVGVDMLDSQLDVARTHQAFHARALLGDAAASNVDFRKGQIEDLKAIGLDDNAYDVVISNCVCNLSPEKEKVFAEVFRVLKKGGEFYFSDVYADRRLTSEAATHPVLIGECLGGALYTQDFRRVMRKVGFKDIRVMSCTPVALKDESLLPLVDDVTFLSVTVRAFKLDDDVVEDQREDYGQTAMYVPNEDADDDDDDGKNKGVLTLDIDHQFKANVPCRIDSNTACILEQSRFRSMFKVSQRTHHNGVMYRHIASNAPAATPTSTLHPAIDCFRPPLLPSPGSVVANGKSSCSLPQQSSSGCGPKQSSGGCGPKQSSSGCSPPRTSSDGGGGSNSCA